MSLDPLSPIVNINYGLTLTVAHRYAEATAQLEKTVQRDPTFPPSHFYLSQVYAIAGRYADAVNELQKSSKVHATWNPDPQGYLKLMNTPGIYGPAPPANVAVAYALAGDREKAFEYLEKSYSEQDSELMAVIRFPAFDSLRSDPRFTALLTKIGLPK
jgi:tetratricopeptide (TPR) repeat protein